MRRQTSVCRRFLASAAMAIALFSPLTEGCSEQTVKTDVVTEAAAPPAQKNISLAPLSKLSSKPSSAWAKSEKLAEALEKEQSPFERISIIQELAAVGGDPAMSKLAVALIQERDSYVRGKMVDAIAKIGGDYAISVLELALREDQHPVIRATAAMRLGDLRNAKAVDALIETGLHDPDGLVRCMSITSLTLIGERDRTVPALITVLLEDSYHFARVSSILALERFGDGRALYPLIRKMKYDPEELVSAEAVRALGVLGDERAIDPLIEALKGMRWRPDYQVLQRLAAWSLAQFSPIAQGANREKIRDALCEVAQNDESESVRNEAEKAIAAYSS